MIDLHCHILPGIDDGSKNIEMSLQLLEKEKRQGVKAITFTPHFHPNRISLDKFVQMREKSFRALTAEPKVQELEIPFRLGAEVYFSTKLNEMELDPLCFSDTNYILIELSTEERPYGLTHTLTDIINRGYNPILAHVERYPYFTSDPTRLYDLIQRGCTVQVNAGAIIEGSAIVHKYIKWGMAQLICSDCHDTSRRVPNMKEAFDLVRKKYGTDYVKWFQKNARDVFKGRYVDLPEPTKPRKILGFWL